MSTRNLHDLANIFRPFVCTDPLRTWGGEPPSA